jgi:chromate reductase, NAD(P)H dehydrogenase (quinone)
VNAAIQFGPHVLLPSSENDRSRRKEFGAGFAPKNPAAQPASFPRPDERLVDIASRRHTSCLNRIATSRAERSTMSPVTNVIVLVGSLRKDSLNRKLANALIGLNAAPLTFQIAEIGDLPLYNQDLDDGTPPAEWVRFREQVRAADAVLFVTPEYNRSVPGVLKNAIDVGSRPYGKSAWEGKPAAVISSSPGGIGGFGANHHLRQSMVFLDAPVMQQPEVYIGGITSLFDPEGNLINDSRRELLRKFVQSFAAWIETNRRK